VSSPSSALAAQYKVCSPLPPESRPSALRHGPALLFGPIKLYARTPVVRTYPFPEASAFDQVSSSIYQSSPLGKVSSPFNFRPPPYPNLPLSTLPPSGKMSATLANCASSPTHLGAASSLPTYLSHSPLRVRGFLIGIVSFQPANLVVDCFFFAFRSFQIFPLNRPLFFFSLT